MAEKGDKLAELFKKKYKKMSVEERQELITKYEVENAENLDDDTLATLILDRIRFFRKQAEAVKYEEKSLANNQRYSNGGFGIRDLGSENHWRDLTQNKKFRITKPTVICLPGNGSITTEKANGFCGMAERLMGLRTTVGDVSSSYDYVDLLGFYYSTNAEEDTAGDYNSRETSEFVDRLLIPLCVDDNGNRLSLEEACKNFSLVTFFTHCYGARVINYLLTDFSDKLNTLNYSKEEIDTILGHSMQVSYSPYTDRFMVPTVELFSQTDSFHKDADKEFYEKYGYYLDGIMYEYENADNEEKNLIHDYIKIITSRLVNTEDNRDLTKLLDEHAIMYLKRDDDWNLNEDARGAKNADLFSIIAGYILSWVVVKSMNTFATGNLHSKHNLIELCQIIDDLMQIYSPEELKK